MTPCFCPPGKRTPDPVALDICGLCGRSIDKAPKR